MMRVFKRIMEVQSSFQTIDDYTGFKMFDFEKEMFYKLLIK
jgi:hypothetical protein